MWYSWRGSIHMAARHKVFISYSHLDTAVFEALTGMLAPGLDGSFELWDDTKIQPGDQWHEAIRAALAETKIAVLLVSANFLKSTFIKNHELPVLLDAARNEGVRIFWIYVSAAMYEQTEIATYEAAHDVAVPLDRLPAAERQQALKEIASQLLATVRNEPGAFPGAKIHSGISPSKLPSTTLVVGREAELKDLDRAWSGAERRNVVTIVAWGGVGKSALVAYWAAEKMAQPDRGGIERYFDWSFFSQGAAREGDAIRADKSGSADLFINTALEYFGDAELAASSAGAWRKGERLAQLAGRPGTLLILDGLEPLQDARTGRLRDEGLRALLRGLATGSSGLCIVTTRHHIPDLDTWRTTAPEWDLRKLSKETGAELLLQLGVRGTQKEREDLAHDVKGHALTLTLLGKYLAEAHEGDIRKHDLIALREADYDETSGHAFRVIEEYERWLENADRHVQLAILRLLGLFDQPATPDCLIALRQPPAIEGLTEQLVDITDGQWNLAVKRLEKLGLIEVQPWESPRIAGYTREEAEAAPATPLGEPRPMPSQQALSGNALDAHPLVREYFGRQLREKCLDGWRAAHERLFEHLQASVPYWPEGLHGLQPLYQAVAHGCQAGRYEDAGNAVYLHRICRSADEKANFYSLRQLGAYASDLAAIAAFFEVPWSRPVPDLDPDGQGWVLSMAASCLAALGRIEEARTPIRLAFEHCLTREDWSGATGMAENFADLEVTRADLPSAIRVGQQGVEAASHEPKSETWVIHAVLACALHQAGDTREALAHFEQAAAILHQEHRLDDLLISSSGFHYAEFLLADAEISAWHAHLLRSIDAYTPPPGVEEIIRICADVERRATSAFHSVTAHHARSSFDNALGHLAAGRASLYRAMLAPDIGSLAEDTIATVNTMLDEFRDSNAQDHLPRGLLTHSLMCALTGRLDDARTELEEAQSIAQRGPMPLHMADIHLHRARLFFRDNLTAARRDLRLARELVEKHGYLRRAKELQDAEKVIL